MLTRVFGALKRPALSPERIRRTARPVRAFGSAALIALALTGTTTPSSFASTSADRIATHAYLIANESWDETQLANLPQSTASIETLAAQISGECPGVLTGAPPAEHVFGPVGPGAPQTSARTEGERNRESRQRDNLKLELLIALDDSFTQSNRDATIALISALSPLKWSAPIVGLSLHLTLEVVQEELNDTTPAPCADMHFWVASGYRTLSPGSKESAKRIEPLFRRVFEILALSLGGHVKPFPQILGPYESAADRALARHVAALTTQVDTAHKVEQATVKRVEAAVGLPLEKPRPSVKHPIAKPALVGRGRTAAGGRFIVRAEEVAHLHDFPSRLHCTANVTIEEPSRPGSGGLLSILSGESPDRCLSRSHVTPEQKVRCNSGLLTIEANLLPAARNVRLLLSDNRTITSPAIRVPARLGGPAGLYYQVLRGPSPIPVALTELDAGGHRLTVLKLAAVVECSKHQRRYFPGGVVRLVQEPGPTGTTFTIRGERYRELGDVHFELKLEEGGSEELFGNSSGGGLLEQKVEEGVGPLGGAVFKSQASTGCTPQPHMIIYGLLRAPHDTVFAEVAGKLVPLRNVVIPARLHAGGALAYGVLSPLPTALFVRNARGKTIARKDLSEAAQADTETCEGEAEG